MNETEQIIRARQGDEMAWLGLVRHHQAAVFHFAYLLLGDTGDAEDIAQETFIRALHALARFDAERPLRPWLLQIAKRLSANRRRSMRRYLAALNRWWQAESNAPTAMEQYSLAQEESQRLWQAVRRLTATDQEVIYLRYFLELSVTETATALNIAEGTVKSRLSRALARLRVIIEREFPGLRAEVAE